MNNNRLRYFMSLSFSDKCLALLYFIALVPCSIKMFMGINARIGLSTLNPILEISLLITLTVLSFRSFKRELKWWDIAVVVSIGWFVLWSPHIYPQTSIAVVEFSPYFLMYCLPYYLVGASINTSKYEDMFDFVGYYGLLVNIFICLLAVLGMAQKLFGEGNNMELAYGVLPSLILVTRQFSQKKSNANMLLVAIGILLIFALGSRGALLSLVAFMAGYLILFREYQNPLLSRIGILAGAGICYLFIEPLLRLIQAITSSFGFGTRVFDMMLGGELISTDSRDWIYDLVSDYIVTDSGHIGYGLFYDRVLMGMDDSSYAHNLIYEMLLNYGVYIGTFLLLSLLLVFVINIRKTKGTLEASLLYAFFCFCIIELFFSSSYLRSPQFWLFIGIMLTTFRRIRETN